MEALENKQKLINKVLDITNLNNCKTSFSL